jgi:hypothetical protein
MEPEIEIIFNLVSRLKSERIFASIEENITSSKENWDNIARSMAGEIVKKVFQQRALNPIPPDYIENHSESVRF